MTANLTLGCQSLLTLKPSVIGRWRIVEMELWDQEFIDLESPGHITFMRNGRGKMHFGAVDLTLDWRLNTKGSPVEFTFEGFDEGDDVTGRGWAELKDGTLTGRVAFHLGNESGFVARKSGKKADCRQRTLLILLSCPNAPRLFTWPDRRLCQSAQSPSACFGYGTCR